MRSMYHLAFLLTLLSGDLSAQNGYTFYSETPMHFSAGPCMGVGHSFIGRSTGTTFIPTWNAGISTSYFRGKHMAYGFDLRYSEEGSRMNSENGLLEKNIHYLRVPVKITYLFGDPHDDLRLKLGAGPCVGFKLTGSENEARNTDLGIVSMVGADYKLLNDVWLDLDVHYYRGFNDVYPSTSRSDMNNSLFLNFGANFGF